MTRTRSHCQPVSKMVAERSATPPATTRAAFSLTGLGKLNTSDRALIDRTVSAPIALPTELVNFRCRRHAGVFARVERNVAVIPAPTTPLLGRGGRARPRDRSVVEPRCAAGVAARSRRDRQDPAGRRSRLGAARRNGFADGVWFVDLASVNDPDLAPATVARAIGIVDMGTGHDVERLCEAIRDRDMLLVLDNFEQVTPAARFVAQLLAAAPRLSILVTSRRPLHLRGEHEIVVPPLGSDDAVALFLARARAVNPASSSERRPRRSSSRSASSSTGCPSPSSWRRHAARCSRRLSCTPDWAVVSNCSRAVPAISRSGCVRCTPRSRGATTRCRPRCRRLPPAVGLLGRVEPGCSGGGVRDDGRLGRSMGWQSCSTTTSSNATTPVPKRGSGCSRPSGSSAATSWRTPATQPAWRAGTRRTSSRSRTPPSASSTKADQAAWLDRVATEHDNIRAALQWTLVEDPKSPSTWPERCGASGCCAAT